MKHFENRLDKIVMILPGAADSTGKLGVPGCASLFMDLATEHAEKLGFGLTALAPQNLFWLTVRTKLCFHRRPEIAETVQISTWPESAEKLRSVRDYAISAGGELLVAGKTQWAVVNTQTGRLYSPRELFPADFPFCEDRSVPEPFYNLSDDFTEVPFAETVVGSADIDLGGHMNNAAYVRMVAGLFTCEEWNGLNVEVFDIHYKSPCYEGNRISWQKRSGESLELRASVEGKTVALIGIQGRQP